MRGIRTGQPGRVGTYTRPIGISARGIGSLTANIPSPNGGMPINMRRKQHFKITLGMFGGTLYIAAVSRDAALRQIKRENQKWDEMDHVYADREDLIKVSKAEYLRAQKKNPIA